MTDALIADGPVLLSLDADGVARLTFNRPEASNGMDVPLLRALYDAIMRCHGEPRVRVVILSGNGPNFCAGGDVKTFASKGEQLPDYLREATSWLQISAASPVVNTIFMFQPHDPTWHLPMFTVGKREPTARVNSGGLGTKHPCERRSPYSPFHHRIGILAT